MVVKERFRCFREYACTADAREFFDRWYGWAARSRWTPMIEFGRKIKSPLPNILTYFRHRITHAASEGFNSRIQSVNVSGRGFYAFENCRTRILFPCGKLDLKPEVTH